MVVHLNRTIHYTRKLRETLGKTRYDYDQEPQQSVGGNGTDRIYYLGARRLMHGRDNLWQKALIGSLEGKRKIIGYTKA